MRNRSLVLAEPARDRSHVGIHARTQICARHRAHVKATLVGCMETMAMMKVFLDGRIDVVLRTRVPK